MTASPAADQTAQRWIDWLGCTDSVEKLAALIDREMHTTEVVAVLEMCEWSALNKHRQHVICPLCGGHDLVGHTPDCRLAALLTHLKGADDDNAEQ